MNLNLIFEPGKPRDMTGWYFFEAAFSREEIAKIKAANPGLDDRNLKIGTVLTIP